MNAYLGLIGALAGAALAGIMAIYLDRQRGNREVALAQSARGEARLQREEDREEARRQRDAEHEERRYRDRLDAYAAFEAQVLVHARRRDKWDEDPTHFDLTPADLYGETSELTELADALVRVQLLANPDAEEAATGLAELLHEYVHHSSSQAQLSDARQRFREAARKDLGTRSRVTSLSPPIR